MMERGWGSAEWMGKWGEGERRGQGWMDGGVLCGREKRAGLDGWGSGMRKRGEGRAGWMGEWDEGERRGLD